MAIRINSGAGVTGSFTLPAYPFTMMTYFQADESLSQSADIIGIHDSGGSPSRHFKMRHSASDNLGGNYEPGEGASIDGTAKNPVANPIDTDFITWWAAMMTLAADGITPTYNLWSGVGTNSLLLPGDITSNSMTGFFLPVQTFTIGPTGSKYINVAEVVLIDRVLTTGQLDLWSKGVPAPQASLPGNILFYQPLITGYNEPISIGTVGFTGTGVGETADVQSVVGPLMVTIDTETLTTGNITTLAQWSEVETDLSGNVIYSDIGQLNNNLILASGHEPGEITNQFHINTTGTSGVADVYDLLDLTQNPINMTLDRSFESVNSISVQNLSTGTGQYLDFNVWSSSGFGEMFAFPGQSIVLHHKSCLHRGDSYTGYLVRTANSIIEITAQSTGVVYEMVILGN